MARKTGQVVRWAAASVVAAAAVAVPATTVHATTPAPSLRVLAGATHLDVERFTGDTYLYIPSGAYMTPVGGTFEIDPRLDKNGDVTLEQVRRSGGTVQHVRTINAPSAVHMYAGLPAFFSMTLSDARGILARGRGPFCPLTDFGAARTGPNGPPTPTYPYFCGSGLTKATVWGLNRGWAEPLSLSLKASASQVPDGDYTLTVAIAPSYARQLGISATNSQVTFGVTITTDNGGCPPKIVCNARAQRAAQIAARHRAPYRSVTPSNQPGLPDLAALPAHELRIEHSQDNGRDYLDFGATIWNAGPGELDVEGFRSGGQQQMVARQFFHLPGKPETSSVIGTFEFDNRKGHHHWHLEDVAQYDLLDSSRHRVVLSEKQSFCLAPTDPIDLTRPGAMWQPDQIGLYSSCPSDQSIWLRETLPPGWGDTYIQAVAGQSFDISGLENGNYFVRITTNPRGRILERTRANDVSLLKIHLGGVPGARTVQKIGAVHP